MTEAAAAQRLAGKAALITGGSRGIGRAIVGAFVAEGARVLTCGRGSAPPDFQPGVAWHSADVSERQQADELIAAARAQLGGINILVNNAGVQIEKTVVESSDEDWERLMGVNAKAVFQLCRGVIPVMAGQGGGAIVNIGSISASHADPRMALYNASKAFVQALTRSIAVDHGPDGIRCNAIAPGWIMTEMADSAFDLARDPAAARADAVARHPVGRLGTPADIAQAAVWLASAEAAFVNGQTITVDGGLVAASPLRPELF